MPNRDQSLPPRQPHLPSALRPREASRSAVGSVSAAPLACAGLTCKDAGDRVTAVASITDAYSMDVFADHPAFVPHSGVSRSLASGTPYANHFIDADKMVFTLFPAPSPA